MTEKFDLNTRFYESESTKILFDKVCSSMLTYLLDFVGLKPTTTQEFRCVCGGGGGIFFLSVTYQTSIGCHT